METPKKQQQQEVAIVGAGISGLLACKYALSKGYRPIIFESQRSIGGLWTKTIKTTNLQSPKPSFQFSDFPWPPSVTQEFPTNDQVLDYIRSYACHFDLLRHIQFDSRVVGIRYEGATDEEMQSWKLWGGTGQPFRGKGKWNIEVEDCNSLSTKFYEADFVILCIGRFSDVPNVPEFAPNEGPEVFCGDVIHSMDYAAMDDATATKFVAGKQVTVVGNQKSAVDIAMECSTANGVEHPCTILYPTEHWKISDFLPWGITIGSLYLSRFAELLIHKPGEGVLLSLIATLLFPLNWAISKFVESYLKWKHPLAMYGMIPSHDFSKDLSACTFAVVPESYYDRIEEGSIILRKTPKLRFCKEGILIDGEASPQKTDIVILATGFRGDKKLRDVFGNPTFQDLVAGSPTATVPLYRGCIQPRIPQLAIVGYYESLTNLYTSEMSCRWLAELLDGTFKLPSIREMEDDIAEWDKYMKRYTGRYYRRSSIAAIHVWYNDKLCKDMKWNHRRKKGLLAELFEPYGPMDYRQP